MGPGAGGAGLRVGRGLALEPGDEAVGVEDRGAPAARALLHGAVGGDDNGLGMRARPSGR